MDQKQSSHLLKDHSISSAFSGRGGYLLKKSVFEGFINFPLILIVYKQRYLYVCVLSIPSRDDFFYIYQT